MVYHKFLLKYFPHQRTIDLRAKISNFQQKPGEAFHEAWEHFRELLSQCPHHLFSDEFLVQRFYDGLTSLGQSLVDMACNGDYGDKTADEMKAIYARLASNSQQKVSKDTKEMANEVGSQSNLTQQVANLTKQIALLVNRDNQPQAPEACAYCGLYGHSANGCMNVDPSTMGYEDVNYVGGYAAKDPNNDPFAPTYNPGWQRHPNLSWRNPGVGSSNQQMGPPGFRPPRPQFQQLPQQQHYIQNQQQQNTQPQPQVQDRRMEDMLLQLMVKMDAQVDRQNKFEANTAAKFNQLSQCTQQLSQCNKSTQASIRNLEQQVGQLAQQKPIKGNVGQGKRGDEEDEKVEIPKPNPSVTYFNKEDDPYVPPIIKPYVTLQVGNESEEFYVFKALKGPTKSDSYSKANVIDNVVKCATQRLYKEPIEDCLACSLRGNDEKFSFADDAHKMDGKVPQHEFKGPKVKQSGQNTLRVLASREASTKQGSRGVKEKEGWEQKHYVGKNQMEQSSSTSSKE
ncbi:Retrotransposon gag protein [Corchorus olitorius]|uniref:Retrotransposon gag protein n=1 Tax=Corchorus olitorius TaxID=93759 RepID=A0A1R3J204_9ROSI|nr:Retrotransposon gag protein [Corchorus olitorius]